jgi:hypothetical protein
MHLLILKNIVLIILELIKNKLCVEVYKGIYEDVLKGDIRLLNWKIIVPSSLTGNPCYMIINYQDAMAIYRYLILEYIKFTNTKTNLISLHMFLDQRLLIC